MQPDLWTSFERQKILVSRETMEKLSIYDALLMKWQKAINLVSAATLDDRFTRHFIDSAQLFHFIAESQKTRMVDMGSGAGFPGLVLGIMGISDVHLIESDIRKATFLRQVSRETGISVTVHDRRIEVCKVENVDLFTARALAPLNDLLGHVQNLATPGHDFQCLFLKGDKAAEEIDKAKKQWNFNEEMHQSATEETGKIIKINDLTKI